MSAAIITKFNSFFRLYKVFIEQVHKYQVYTFLVDCGRFEEVEQITTFILKLCHVARSDKSLKQYHDCITEELL